LCFDCEEDAFAAVEQRRYKEGDIIVIPMGARGGPGMRESCRRRRRFMAKGSARRWR